MKEMQERWENFGATYSDLLARETYTSSIIWEIYLSPFLLSIHLAVISLHIFHRSASLFLRLVQSYYS